MSGNAHTKETVDRQTNAIVLLEQDQKRHVHIPPPRLEPLR